jgi:hypothetical protein
MRAAGLECLPPRFETWSVPNVCRKFDTYASCRTCLADQSGNTLLMASVRGR